MTGEELRQWVTDNGFPAFRAAQIGDWLGKGVTNFDEMRNLPADLKKNCKQVVTFLLQLLQKNKFHGMIKQ